MSPFQHGEVFVTEYGAETDLDLGHYERFIDEDLNKFSNLTSGKVYWNVLNKERGGEYLGETVQMIPHIPRGGTIRLGGYPCVIRDNTKIKKAYNKKEITERHRHRYELNHDYRGIMEEARLFTSGTSPDGFIAETIELPEKDFFAGVQFHPEFKTRPNKAQPLFLLFIKSAMKERTA